MKARALDFAAWARAGVFLLLLLLFFPPGGLMRTPAGTLRPQRGHPLVDPGQPLAVLIDVDRRKGRAEPLVILLQATITHLNKAEDALEHPEGPLHLGAHFRLCPVPGLLRLVHACRVSACREVIIRASGAARGSSLSV